MKRLAAVSVVLVSCAYLVPVSMRVPLGSGILSALTARNFHDAEGGFRWSRAHSSVVFPEPGTGLRFRIEAELSGFRPRGGEPPLVVLSAGGREIRSRPPRSGETLVLHTENRSWWRSDVEVTVRSETFTPGEMDRRALGVRVHRIALVPEGGIGRPPLRPVVLAAAGVLLAFSLLSRLGAAGAFGISVGLAMVAALGFVFLRPYAALLSGPVVLALLGASLLERFFPGLAPAAGRYVRSAARAFGEGTGMFLGRAAAAQIALGGVGVVAAYLARPAFEVDLGSGHETSLARGFGSFDQDGGVNFRRALRGAAVDLRDFGGGSQWRIGVRAALGRSERAIVLARAGEAELRARLGPDWSSHSVQTAAPFGWRSGVLLEFPSAVPHLDLRIDRIRVERGASLPSLRVLLLVVGASLFIAAAFRSCGMTKRSSGIAACGALLLLVASLALAPVLSFPFLPAVLAITASAWVLAGVLRPVTQALAPPALAAALCGFMAWLAVTLSPLYEGGHFVFHSSIAEEIWQGRFLTYYLPYPGSMLSRQAQWGDVIVPHSCLYHTLMAPLAALPLEWFYRLEKAALALMLLSLAVVSSSIAARLAPREGARASLFTALFAIGLPPTFQLLELGHLMTIFGCSAAALALGFVILRLERLGEGRIWWTAVVLLALCFLSYTASLLFTFVTLGLALPLLLRRAPVAARALAGAAALAALAAFLLYYVHWTWPFLRESVPALLGRGGAEGAEAASFPIWDRLAAQPGKLAYTFGAAWIAAAGLGGLAIARPSAGRLLLASWASVLIIFCVLDVFFNFLLKHHYFVIPPVSVGAGLLAARLFEKGRWGGSLALLFVVSVWGMAVTAGLRVASGSG